MKLYIKHFRFISIIVCAVTLLISCDSPVGFTKAQPDGVPDLRSFPEAFKGTYICEQDSVLIRVEETVIYSEYTEIALIPMRYVQNREDCKIVNDSLYIEGREECVKIEYMQGGMISAKNITRDTIFEITQYQKARMHKGNLVLSQPTENGLWAIGVLELDRDKGVIYKSIVDESDMDRIEAITPMTAIIAGTEMSPQYKINPKRVELDQLFNDPTVFIDCNYYARVHLIH